MITVTPKPPPIICRTLINVLIRLWPLLSLKLSQLSWKIGKFWIVFL